MAKSLGPKTTPARTSKPIKIAGGGDNRIPATSGTTKGSKSSDAGKLVPSKLR